MVDFPWFARRRTERFRLKLPQLSWGLIEGELVFTRSPRILYETP